MNAVRVAVYARVSTEAQELEGQERELRAYVSQLGWVIAATYREKISGTGKVERKEYDRLLRDARDSRRPWSALVVWSLDRFSREERFTRAVDAIWDLERLGIEFHSVKEPYLDTPPRGERNLGRELLLGILPTIAAFESIRRAERTRVAMSEIRSGRRATRSGKPVGRPRRLLPEVIERVVRLSREGLRSKEIAQRVGLPAGTVRKALWLSRKRTVPFQTAPVPKGKPTGRGVDPVR